MKLTDKGGRQISLILFGIIVLAAIILIAGALRTRTKKVKDRHLESRTSVQCKICGRDNPPEARFCANCGATLVTTVEPPSAAVPGSPPVVAEVAAEYIGFWIRLGASIIDGIIIFFISFVLSRFLLSNIYGYRFSLLPSFFWFPVPWLYYLFWFPVSWLYYWLFTGLKGQTPGKMVVGIKVVDARGDRVGLGVAALREILGKTLSAYVLCIGFLWIIGDRKKQGWHDKIASTYVVKAVKVESKE